MKTVARRILTALKKPKRPVDPRQEQLTAYLVEAGVPERFARSCAPVMIDPSRAMFVIDGRRRPRSR